ncbi:hypothetical protein BU14_0585s0006 [Porphyra umbilicalis]|uniref:Uncharacterized protein n=1 Tax=Porphyra umbilicalis TaxID=2786 RepID=A0A1X6NRA9_PORUM|nr:hypothetical protein BU14_0585s0006 [Porphyra umbilicalis]|eukprot:OSX71159.1 hypothetical protein BU14_0585s0006 [Porphyra umbilicalis]
MATRRTLLQYSDAERQWLFAEDGNVERRLSASGLRNAAVWRTTETFSGEPFTQGMMDAPDTALGMDLAYLTRALATANPMTSGRFLYDEENHELLIRLNFAGNITVLRYKMIPSSGIRERSVTMFAPPPGDDGSGEVLPSVVTSHLDIIDTCYGGRHGDAAPGVEGGPYPPPAALGAAEALDPTAASATFTPSAATVRTSVVDFEGFGASVAARLGGLFQPCLSGVMFGTPFSQDAGGWVADGLASAQTCLRLAPPEAVGPQSAALPGGGGDYHFHPTLPSLPPDAMDALERSFASLAFASTPTRGMSGRLALEAGGGGAPPPPPPPRPSKRWTLLWLRLPPPPPLLPPAATPWGAPDAGPVDLGHNAYAALPLLSPVSEPLLDGAAVYAAAAAAAAAATAAPAGAPAPPPPSWPPAAEVPPTAAAAPPYGWTQADARWTAAEPQLMAALYGTPPPTLPPPNGPSSSHGGAVGAPSTLPPPYADGGPAGSPPYLVPAAPPVGAPSGAAAADAYAAGGVAVHPLGAAMAPRGAPVHPHVAPAQAPPAAPASGVASEATDVRPSAAQIEGFSRLFAAAETSSESVD